MLRLLACVLALLCAWPSEARPRRPQQPRQPRQAPTLADRLALHLRRPPVGDRSEFAVAVARVGEPKPFFAHNVDRPLILASTTKLFTSAAALDRLGAGYRFRTRLYLGGDVQPDGTLAGPLVIVGGGDPGITGRLYENDPYAVFRPWAEALKAKGVRRIRDGFLLDTSFFDDVRAHPDWPADQEQNWYQAPISALSYNDNVVLVQVTGGLRPGARALFGFYPAGPASMSIVGTVTTAQAPVASVGIQRRAGSGTVYASGIVGRNRTWLGDITVPDPPLYLAAALRKVLREEGIEVPNQSRVRTEPSSGPQLPLAHVHETSLIPALAVCNKRSQGFYAEQILKTLGAEKRGRGTWDNGRKEVAEFLRTLGLDPARYALADGSGRSRENRASAAAYIDFLQALATRWPLFSTYEPTMAISGDQEGSLRHRLLGKETRGRIHAKTGNIAGVVTLCGYLDAPSGARYAFSILINGGCGEGRGHAWQDRFLTELARSG